MHAVLPIKPRNMGIHRFSETKDLKQWTKRIQDISEETKKPFQKKMTGLRKHLKLLEQQAINIKGARGEFMQTVLHKGAWKYKP